LIEILVGTQKYKRKMVFTAHFDSTSANGYNTTNIY